ncbi:hypothetical protein H3V02_07610 [Bifidobacterium sp. W8106]|uniref:hypothetical protein n=1 Tax=Bifidobacterium TaxID=1678 RepID=UPI0018DD4E66|nr:MULTISPECIES: hypothetical protein [Bifidobacterium]MBI0143037.1 hypothetical protein [Bifidobacterium choladohabitans]MBI0147529.1 hypothetical protein [Bifidobacterium sp. W8104]
MARRHRELQQGSGQGVSDDLSGEDIFSDDRPDLAAPGGSILLALPGTLVDWDPRRALVGQYPDGVIDMVLDPEDLWGFTCVRRQVNLGVDPQQALADYETTHGPAVAWVVRVCLENYTLAVKGLLPGASELLGDLRRAGLTLWGLAATTSQLIAAISEVLSPLSALKGTLISSKEHLDLSDPLFYRLALRRFAISPGHTIFVDADPEHVAIADRLGMDGILAQDISSLRQHLRQRGIAC